MTNIGIREIVGLSVFIAAGCQDHTPPPPRASVPPVGMYNDEVRVVPGKPLPPPEMPHYQPPFTDEPLITQVPPEQAVFVDAYAQVGRPRISLFVNRSLEGQIIPTNAGGRVAGVQNTRETDGAIKMESTRGRVDQWGRPIDERTDRFETQGPARVTDRTEVYLAPGQYDEVAAKRVDYDAIENILTDWLAAGGKVSMISAKLSEAQIKDLQKGRRNVLNELSKDNQVDVLIQVQAHATRQTERGLEVRLVAEAINTQGGESIGRAVVDLPPPLEKRAINEYTRFLARKLMYDMSRTWSNPAPAPRTGASQAPPTTQP
ncbi:MAG: hypothetical protein H7144_17755 [Burkholderiales bacterium]|nr:hypothetical protein [Phycisphaerae bacterium]